MLNMYKALENQVISEKTSGIEKAKCAEIAANIAIDVLKMEAEGIHKVVKDALIAEKEIAKAAITNSDSTRDLDMPKMIDDDESEEEKVY
jgi:hypothetical protein